MNIPLLFLYTLNGLLMVGMPVALGLFLRKRFAIGWRFFGVGALTFVLSQVGHIPFNLGLTALFQAGVLPAPPAAYKLAFNAVVLGLSAGVWEECFRYIAYRWMAKDARSWAAGLMLGAGHGGIEAIIFGFLALYSLLQIVALSGIVDLSTVLPAAQVETVQSAIAEYWSNPWYMGVMGAVERVFAILFHLTASVMVLQVFLGRGRRWLLYAIIWHAVLDATAVWLTSYGKLAPEVGLLVLSVVNVVILYYLSRTTPPAPDVSQPQALPLAPAPLEPLASFEDPEDEDLDHSKFQ